MSISEEDAARLADDYDRPEVRVQAQAEVEYLRLKGRKEAERRVAEEQVYDFSTTFTDALLDAGDFTLPTATNYLVKGVIGRETVTMLHAAPGVGKTFCAVDLAAHIATGRTPWAGEYRVRKGKVLYVYSEGGSKAALRLLAWCQHHGVPQSALAGQFIVYPRAVPLNGSATAVDALREFIVDHGIEFVVIDTWATATAGSDENSASEMGVALDRAGSLRDQTNASVLIVHHDNKTGGYRGSSAIHGFVDAAIQLERAKDSKDEVKREEITFYLAKVRDGLDGVRWTARLEQVNLGYDEEGDPLSSAVWARDAVPVGGLAAMTDEEVVWNWLAEHSGEFTQTGAATAMADEGWGVAKRRVGDVIKTFAAQGKVEMRESKADEGGRAVSRVRVHVVEH